MVFSFINLYMYISKNKRGTSVLSYEKYMYLQHEFLGEMLLTAVQKMSWRMLNQTEGKELSLP